MIKLAVNQIKAALPQVNCFQESCQGTILLDEKIKELVHDWQNNDCLTFCVMFLCASPEEKV